MAKVIVAGDAVVITTSMTVEQIKKLKKFNPDALLLKNEETGEAYFGVDFGATGNANQYGVSFNREAPETGLASLTVHFGCGIPAPAKETIADLFGSAIVNLEKIEAIAPNAIAVVDAERAAVMEHIQVNG